MSEPVCDHHWHETEIKDLRDERDRYRMDGSHAVAIAKDALDRKP